jgi:hypothetical protein
LGAARQFATEARTLLSTTDLLDLRGDVTATLSEVLSAARDYDGSRQAAAEAVRLYQQKGNVVAAARSAQL